MPRAKFARLEPEKAINGLDQKLYEKMTASIKDVKISYGINETVEDQEIKAKAREQLNQRGNTGSEGTKSRRKTG